MPGEKLTPPQKVFVWIWRNRLLKVAGWIIKLLGYSGIAELKFPGMPQWEEWLEQHPGGNPIDYADEMRKLNKEFEASQFCKTGEQNVLP